MRYAQNTAPARCTRPYDSNTPIAPHNPKPTVLIGSNVSAMGSGTLGVYLNAAALAINQDALGVQARRVAFAAPSNASLAPPWDAQAVVAACDAARPTQAWTWTNRTPPSGPATSLFEVACAAADATQTWAFAADGTLRNDASGLCVSAPRAGCAQSPAQLAPCDAALPEQQWQLLAGGQIKHRGAEPASCLDIPNGAGPAVAWCNCHPPGTATNQEWTLGADGRLASAALPGTCIGPLAGEPGGALQTTDADGNVFCLSYGDEEGSWHGIPCDADRVNLLTPVPVSGAMPPPGVRANFTFAPSAHHFAPGWAGAPGTSGPWPRTQYVTGSGRSWTLALGVAGPIVARDAATIWDNDFVQPPAQSGAAFCLDLVAAGGLETWAAPLAGGRVAAALLNRSPGPDTITVQWADIGLPAGSTAHVFDAWTGDLGVHMDSFAMTVASKDVALLTLTPV